MDVDSIRPHCRYVGNDGVTMEVVAIVMAVDGKLYVDARASARKLPEAWAKRKNYIPIEAFAQWAFKRAEPAPDVASFKLII